MKKTIPEPGESWGILGGAFDPVHNGHINLANQIANKLKLVGVFIVPAVSHPFKFNLHETVYSDRVTMLKLAIAGNSKLHLLEIEKDNNLSGYTIDTVKALKEKFPQINFTFIVGTDNIVQIESWHHPEQIFEQVSVVAGKRPGVVISKQYQHLIDKIKYCEIDEVNISSTEIREQIGQKNYNKLTGLVCDKVVKYIKEKELYLND